MATINANTDKPFRNSENIKYILVTGGVMSGVGKGVIASSLATLLQLCGIEVTSIKIDPYINVDCGTMSPFEHEVVLKAKWKGLRDNFRVEYKRIPRLDNGEFRIDPSTFESKWIHYYALLFLREVYVLDDGSEVDLDLGNYERFLDVNLHADNSITTGKIYQLVIQKERRGDYLGKTVQVVPHLTNAIEEWVERVAQKPVRDNKKPQVCIIELGGTTGDIEGMPFVEAFRTFQNRKKSENFCLAHVSPVSFWAGEHKTKPTQGSVRVLRSHDLKPDLIFCRSAEETKEGKSLIIEAKEKISHFCNVPLEQIIWVHDVSSIYRVPLLLEEHGVIEFLNERFQLNIKPNVRERCLQKWKQLARRSEMLRKEVSIALVGKYTKLKDSYASVIKALEHASLQVGYKLKLNFIDSSLLESETLKSAPSEYHKEWQLLCESDGVVVPGGFGARGMEGKIKACEWCRKNHKPFLGICLGLQAAVIEFARNVLDLDEANTTEINKDTPNPVIIDMEGHCTGEYGGTMRLGKHTTTFNKDVNSIIKQLYGNVPTIEERHRHRYEVNPAFKNKIESKGLHFVATGDNGKRMEIIELDDHPYYVGTQFHPEFLSRPMKPSPPFLGFILASVKGLDKYLAGGCRLSPWQISDASSDDDDDNQFLMSTKMNGLKVNGHYINRYKETNGAIENLNGELTPPEKLSVDNTTYIGNGFGA